MTALKCNHIKSSKVSQAGVARGSAASREGKHAKTAGQFINIKYDQ